MSLSPYATDISATALLEERLRFETFLSGLIARFLNQPMADVDQEITRGLEGLLEALDVDRCGLSTFTAGAESLSIQHFAARPGVPRTEPGDMVSKAPWYSRELLEGRAVVLRRLPGDLPAEAAEDRAYVVDIGLKGNVTLPLTAEGRTLGALGVGSFRGPLDWSPALIARLELLAGVFAGVLHRREAEARLRAAEVLNRSVLESLSSELVVLDSAGRILAMNDGFRRSARRETLPLPAIGDDYVGVLETAGLLGIRETPEAVTGLRRVVAGELPLFDMTYRYRSDAGEHHYFLAATPLRDADGGGGAVILHTDVTELQQARAELERSLQEIRELKDRLEAENVLLNREVRHVHGFETIVGRSPALDRVLSQIEQVAPTDSPVLLLGETGTGKDLVARALHDRSRRRERPMVSVSCAALPPTLIESELFGYERGAFTGALQRSIGRFEIADRGTLFLDEIGELPLEVQAKLLRVLQSGEFERLGSPRTIKTNVRLVAATNRDLEREMHEGRFRADLYYRLSVFPVVLPPLRDRPEDIPLLVWHFISRKQAEFGKTIKRVPERLMRVFSTYAWPGNVRELENVVERALILSEGPSLAADPFSPDRGGSRAPGGGTLEDMERSYIRAVLVECNWKVAGAGNAADRLGLNRSTLQFRMKKLGIERPERSGD